MSWNYRTEPLYRWLLAESADLEWQCVEEEFQHARGTKLAQIAIAAGPQSEMDREK